MKKYWFFVISIALTGSIKAQIYSTVVSAQATESGSYLADFGAPPPTVNLNDSNSDLQTSSHSGEIEIDLGTNDYFSNAHAYANSSIGRIGVSVAGATSDVFQQAGNEANFRAASRAFASFSDNLLFQSALIPIGAPINVVVNIQLGGGLEFTKAGFYAGAQSTGTDFQLTLGAKHIMTTENGDPFGPPNWSTFAPGNVSLSTQVLNGSRVGFSLSGSAAGLADANSGHAYHATYQINFLNTLAWDGLVSATDQEGNNLSDLSIVGDEGTSYRQSFGDSLPPQSSVPEPSSYGLLGSVALILTVLVRAKSRYSRYHVASRVT